MSVTTVKAQLAALEATIPGVVRAYSEAPWSLPATELPAFVNFTGPSSLRNLGSNGGLFFEETREYRLKLFVANIQEGISGEAEIKCYDFAASVRDFFLARPGLGLQHVQMTAFLGDNGIQVMALGEENFIGIEFRIQVKEFQTTQYATGY